MNTMEYKGYYGTVTYDDEAGTFFGRVNNLPKNGITFEGKSVEELRTAFRESVDDYLAWCKERGEARGESLNDFVTKAIEDEIATEAMA
jgi:predicted HicB family RNase H-like nuclease